MDDRGYWHNPTQKELVAERTAALMNEDRDRSTGGERPRFIMEVAGDELVRIVCDDGSYSSYIFNSAEKNKVTLSGVEDAPQLPLNLSDIVYMERATGERVKAQVWDRRNGKLILRTLPVH